MRAFHQNKKAKIIISVTVYIVFILLILSSSTVYGSKACCDKVVSVSNLNTLGPLLKQMTQNILINKSKEILAQKLQFNYLLDSFALKIYGLNNITNFLPVIDNLQSNIMKESNRIINSTFKFDAFSQQFNNSVNNAMKKELITILREKGVSTYEIPAIVEQVGLSYNNFLNSNSVTNLYEKSVSQYASEMGYAVNNALKTNRHIINLGGGIDLSELVVSGNSSGNTNRLKNESIAIYNDAVNYVDSIYGYTLRQSIRNDFTYVNGRFIEEKLRNISFCDNYNKEHCVVIDDNDIQRLVNATNNTAIKETENILNKGKNALYKTTDNIYNSLAYEINKDILSRSNIIKKTIEQEKANEYFSSVDYYARIERDIKSLMNNRQNINQIIASDEINIEDTKTLAQLLGNPLSKNYPKQLKEQAITRLVAAHRAIDVANKMSKLLRQFNLSAIDSATPEQAWKDTFRFYYYLTLLQNETLRLKSVSLMSNALNTDYNGIIRIK